MKTRQDAIGAGRAIAISDAVALLAEELGDVSEARRMLVELAEIGDLSAVANRAHGPFLGEFLNERDWPIPPSLWEGLDASDEAAWRKGDFTAAPDNDRYAELQPDFDKPLRLLGIRLNLEEVAHVAASLPVEWIDAHAAIDMLLPAYGKGNGYEVAKALAVRAHSGLLKTRARLLKWEQSSIDGYRLSEKVLKEASFASLPKEFWWAEGHTAMKQDWVAGDFSTFMEEQFLMQAFGTEFSRNGVARMIPARISARADSELGEPPLDRPQIAEEGPSQIPSDEAIRSKMLELIDLGVKRDVAAKIIRQIGGFGSVGNDHARRVVSGSLARGRPRKTAENSGQ